MLTIYLCFSYSTHMFLCQTFSIMLDEISMPWSLQSPYLNAVFLLLSPTLPIMEGNNSRSNGILGQQ